MGTLVTDNIFGLGNTNPIKGSLFFEGKSSYLSMASGEIISGTGFGTNDFTVEFWINQGVNASNYTILINLNASTNTDRFEVAFHSSTIRVYTDTGSWRDTGYAPVSGQWEHIAFVRNYSGNTLKMYANGVEKWSVSNNHDYNEVYTTQIGSYASTSYGYFEGYLSNFRVVNGTALYTTNNFTPPTEELTVVENTVLLCCQDSDNALQEATGKTITGFGNLGSGDDTNLLTNGDFSVDISSWTVAQGSASWSSGKLYMSGTSGNSIEQNVTTVVGKLYRFTATVDNTANVSYNIGMQFGPTLATDSSYQASDTIQSGTKTFVVDHIAESTTTTADLWGGTSVTGYWSNVSVKLHEPPKAYKSVPTFGALADDGVVFADNTKFDTQAYMVPPKGTTEQRGRGRALIAGGTNGGGWGTKQNVISYIEIQSGGIIKDFGDLSSLRSKVASVSSSTRAVFGGGSEGASANNAVDTMEYVTIATTGNVTAFGDALESNRRPRGGVSNNTRGLFGGGYISSPGSAEVDHITIATTASVTDYGDLSVSGTPNEGSSNSTRGVYMGGGWGAQIEYVTIASTGSGADFGTVGNNRVSAAAASSSTRALLAGGGTAENAITYIEFATLSSDTDFGDLTQGRRTLSGTSNGLRGIFCGGYTPDYNIIDYVNISTVGNAKDFGDLTTALREPDACSDSHGGIS